MKLNCTLQLQSHCSKSSTISHSSLTSLLLAPHITIVYCRCWGVGAERESTNSAAILKLSTGNWGSSGYTGDQVCVFFSYISGNSRNVFLLITLGQCGKTHITHIYPSEIDGVFFRTTNDKNKLVINKIDTLIPTLKVYTE